MRPWNKTQRLAFISDTLDSCTCVNCTPVSEKLATWYGDGRSHWLIDQSPTDRKFELTRTAQTANADPIRIRSPYPKSGSGWLPNFNGNFTVQRYISGKIFTKIRSGFSRYISQIVENALSALTNLQKIPDPDPDVNDFQNLIITSLSTDASVVKFPRRFDQLFLREVSNGQTNRQTDRQTDIVRNCLYSFIHSFIYLFQTTEVHIDTHKTYNIYRKKEHRKRDRQKETKHTHKTRRTILLSQTDITLTSFKQVSVSASQTWHSIMEASGMTAHSVQWWACY